MTNDFKIKKYWTLAFCMLFCSITTVLAQELTDEQLGFNRELARKELLSSGAVKAEEIEGYLDKLREDAVLKKKIGFDAWLASKEDKSSNLKKKKGATSATSRFAGDDCEQYTFNDPDRPFLGWTLSNNTSFRFTDSFTEQSIIINDTVKKFVLDQYGLYRFSIMSPADFTPATDPYIGAPPSRLNSSNVVRVGNSAVLVRKERISKEFILTDPTDFIFYDFAIVLQDPRHDERPFYAINLYVNGVLKPCARVSYEAFSGIPGFVDQGGNVWVRPWSSNIIRPSDFDAVEGDTVRVEVSVSDCGYGGHFGYGYFDIQCKTQDEIIQTSCPNETVSFTTELDASTTKFEWEIKEDGNPIHIENNKSSTFKYKFNHVGNYTVDLKVFYFTTTLGCNTPASVFRKIVKVEDICSSQGCDDCTSFDLVKKEKYLVSAWVKETNDADLYEQLKNYAKSCVSISFTDVSGSTIGTPLKFNATGEIIDGWQRIVGEFTVPENADDMNLELVNENTDANRMVYFDDIRVLPTKGSMKSFVYDQATQRLMAELDENNYSTFYEYDLEGGLVRIKKETEKGLYTIQETRSGNAKSK